MRHNSSPPQQLVCMWTPKYCSEVGMIISNHAGRQLLGLMLADENDLGVLKRQRAATKTSQQFTAKHISNISRAAGNMRCSRCLHRVKDGYSLVPHELHTGYESIYTAKNAESFTAGIDYNPKLTTSIYIAKNADSFMGICLTPPVWSEQQHYSPKLTTACGEERS